LVSCIREPFKALGRPFYEPRKKKGGYHDPKISESHCSRHFDSNVGNIVGGVGIAQAKVQLYRRTSWGSESKGIDASE
jgi:hypothetical protein